MVLWVLEVEINAVTIMKLKTISAFDNSQILGIDELKALVGGSTHCQCYYSYNYEDENHQLRTNTISLVNSSGLTGSDCLSACANACTQSEFCGSENLKISFTTSGSGSGSGS